MGRKKAEVIDPYGQGKFLCAENLKAEDMSFGTKDFKDLPELTIKGCATVVIDPRYLEVPHFLAAIEDSAIRVFRQDAPPRARDLSVPPDLTLSDPMLERHAIAIVSNPAYGHVSKTIINAVVYERGSDDTIDKNYLRSDFSKLLKNVKYRESKWRNRPELISDINRKLQEIQEL